MAVPKVYPPPKFTSKPGSKFRGYGTLTKPKFDAWAAANNRPGNYENYRTYLENHRVGQGARAPAQAPAKPALPTLASLLAGIQIESPAQLEARANRMTQQGITSQTAIIREEAKMMRDEALRRMEAQAAAGRMAAGMNSQLLGMVGGEYNAAAQEIAGLGTNLSGGIAGDVAADTATQNAGLAAVGAPGLTVGGPAGGPGLGGATQQGVESYRGGTIPSQVTGTAGQAAQFGLAGMIGAQNLRATQEAQAAMQESIQTADKARVSAIKELAAGRPEMAAKFLAQLQDANRQSIGLATGIIQQRAAAQNQTFEQGVTKTKLNMDKDQQAFDQAAEITKLDIAKSQLGASLNEIDVNRSFALGYVVDKRGAPVLRDGKRVPAKTLLNATTKSTTKGRTMTPGQRVELIKSAQQFAETAFYGYGEDEDGKRVPMTQIGSFDPNDAGTYGTGAMQYGTALNRLVQLGLTPAGASDILNSYYGRGDMGRPVFSSAEIKVLRRMLGPQKFKWAATQIASLLQRQEGAAADKLINEVLAGGKGIAWVGKKP